MSNQPKQIATRNKITGTKATNQSIFLVGMMGVGKTTIGRQLALQLGWDFIDLDHVIEDRSGVPIATIFDIEGEDGFRRRESAMLDECTQLSQTVLATGGGAVLAEENRALLCQRGFVIYLRAEVEVLYRRLQRDTKRPLLQTEDPQQRIRDLLQLREPLYASVADVVFDTQDKPVYMVLQDLLEILNTNVDIHLG